MTHESSDRATNRVIVAAFLKVAGIPISEDAICDAGAPLPDVLCTLGNGSRVAFELTEAVDQGLARNVRVSSASKARMCDHYRQLPLADQTRLRRIFANADISVRAKDGTTDRRFDQAVPKVFALLLGCSCDTEGNIEKRTLPTDVEEIRITRGKWSTGPWFNRGQAQWVANVMIERIKAKFSKRYECDCPVELLVHSKTCRFEPDNLWKSDVHDFVMRNIAGSPFRGVSVFDWIDSSIRYTYPEGGDRSCLAQRRP
jgi:hypothetical protein